MLKILPQKFVQYQVNVQTSYNLNAHGIYPVVNFILRMIMNNH